jgi:hypothetical protein
VDSFFICHKDDLAETISKPQEYVRLQVPREFLLGTMSGMNDVVQSCIRDLVFNLDEVEVAEWENHKSKQVVFPSATSSQTIHHEVNQNLKHITVITYIAASGQYIISYIIMLQESDGLREALRTKGIAFGRHLILKKNQKPYVNNKSFAEYIKSTFRPRTTRIHAGMGIEQENAVLLLDNCPSYLISDVRDLLSTVRVRVVAFVPHTTQIFQLLDLTLFGTLKLEGKDRSPSPISERRSISYTTYV